MLVLAVTGLALAAALVALVRRRTSEQARTALAGGPPSLDEALAATLGASTTAPPPPPVPQVPLADLDDLSDLDDPPATVPTPARRSPWASRPAAGRRIKLPDDGSDPAIGWRADAGSLARPETVVPAPRPTRLTDAGRIGLVDDSDRMAWDRPADRS
ncbi:hypothetical protein [Nocardioides litoris]|uniref:hypothetical protein n=1 Tax=Nocardioides litoris TaxID=1926648 RepID=UPI001124672C|nr:hypothetical protein [Nocardioides litoris]